MHVTTFFIHPKLAFKENERKSLTRKTLLVTQLCHVWATLKWVFNALFTQRKSEVGFSSKTISITQPRQ